MKNRPQARRDVRKIPDSGSYSRKKRRREPTLIPALADRSTTFWLRVSRTGLKGASSHAQASLDRPSTTSGESLR